MQPCKKRRHITPIHLREISKLSPAAGPEILKCTEGRLGIFNAKAEDDHVVA
jgi:hypothetical protein